MADYNSSYTGAQIDSAIEKIRGMNIVTSVDSSSTDTDVPSAKLLYDTVGDIETLLASI